MASFAGMLTIDLLAKAKIIYKGGIWGCWKHIHYVLYISQDEQMFYLHKGLQHFYIEIATRGLPHSEPPDHRWHQSISAVSTPVRNKGKHRYQAHSQNAVRDSRPLIVQIPPFSNGPKTDVPEI
jgi:hypothetical protein